MKPKCARIKTHETETRGKFIKSQIFMTVIYILLSKRIIQKFILNFNIFIEFKLENKSKIYYKLNKKIF